MDSDDYSRSSDEDQQYLQDLAAKCHRWIRKATKESLADDLIYSDKSEFAEYIVTAFTHKTVDPQDNYELLESEGDLILKGITGPYIFKVYDDQYEFLSPDVINNVSKVYVSNDTYAKILKREGLRDFIHDYELIMKKQEKDIGGDVFEALIAAIFKTATSLYNIGEAYKIIYEIMEYYLNKYMKTYDLSDPDAINILKNPTQYLKELFNKLGWGDPRYRFDIRNGMMNITNPSNELIGKGRDKVKKKAKEKAVKNALEYIRKKGIITIEEERGREKSKQQKLSVRELQTKAQEASKKMGYTRGLSVKTTSNGIAIYGNKGNKQELLANGLGKTNDERMRDAYSKIISRAEQ